MRNKERREQKRVGTGRKKIYLLWKEGKVGRNEKKENVILKKIK